MFVKRLDSITERNYKLKHLVEVPGKSKLLSIHQRPIYHFEQLIYRSEFYKNNEDSSEMN